jgi:hypothetical protein
MKNKNLEKDINSLELSKDVLKLLRDHDINFVKDVWVLKRKDLKSIGLKDSDINTLVVKMQLFGLDINKKIYSKD